MNALLQIAIAMSLNALDLVTGLIGALRKKDLKSYRLRDGLFKKVGFIFCYLLAWMIDQYGYVIGFQIGIPILPVVVLYAATTEIVSILENIHEINPDLLPSKLMELFHIEGSENGRH